MIANIMIGVQRGKGMVDFMFLILLGRENYIVQPSNQSDRLMTLLPQANSMSMTNANLVSVHTACSVTSYNIRCVRMFGTSLS